MRTSPTGLGTEAGCRTPLFRVSRSACIAPPHDVSKHLSHDDVFNISRYGFTFHKLFAAWLSNPGPTKAVRSSFNTYNVMRYTVGA